MEKYFKKAVSELEGYTSPPQKDYKAKLNQNESPFDVPQELKNKLCRSAQELAWHHYPLNESPELAGKLAAWHQVAADQVLLGNGSNQLLQTLLTAVLEQNDSVLYCPPSFSLFDLFPVIYGGRLETVPRPPGTNFPLEGVLDRLAATRPKIVLLCSPNNPTGDDMNAESLSAICEKAHGLVLMDEAYAEFSGTTCIPLIKKYPNLVISRTFSKAFSLAGLRFGYLLGDSAVIAQLRKANLPYNVNLFTELVASRLLDDKSFMQKQVKYICNERDRLFAEMKSIAHIKAYRSFANFILFKCGNAQRMFSQLKQAGVLVRDVSEYPLLENHLRVSVGSKTENDLFLHVLRGLEE
ncbi:histidinol-phosphate transaminase [candidate division KSB1 bacterium]|nr:histidinol-phosphate transaminase [candidate division KSB1 bacterium]